MGVMVVAAAVSLAYFVFLGWRLGLHQRLPLALRPISLERIPDRAARRYGDRPLFTCDRPVSWRVPALAGRYTDDTIWSASRVLATAGYLATMLREQLGVRAGERVAILKQNHFDVHLLITGIVRAGGIACPLNGHFEAANVGPYLENVGAKVLIRGFVHPGPPRGAEVHVSVPCRPS